MQTRGISGKSEEASKEKRRPGRRDQCHKEEWSRKWKQDAERGRRSRRQVSGKRVGVRCVRMRKMSPAGKNNAV